MIHDLSESSRSSVRALVDITYHYSIDGEGTQDCDTPHQWLDIAGRHNDNEP